MCVENGGITCLCLIEWGSKRKEVLDIDHYIWKPGYITEYVFLAISYPCPQDNDLLFNSSEAL